MKPLLRLDNLTLSFGGDPLLDHVDLTIHPGRRIALMALLNGELQADDGEIWRRPGARIAMLQQPLPGADVKELRWPDPNTSLLTRLANGRPRHPRRPEGTGEAGVRVERVVRFHCSLLPPICSRNPSRASETKAVNLLSGTRSDLIPERLASCANCAEPHSDESNSF